MQATHGFVRTALQLLAIAALSACGDEYDESGQYDEISSAVRTTTQNVGAQDETSGSKRIAPFSGDSKIIHSTGNKKVVDTYIKSAVTKIKCPGGSYTKKYTHVTWVGITDVSNKRNWMLPSARDTNARDDIAKKTNIDKAKILVARVEDGTAHNQLFNHVKKAKWYGKKGGEPQKSNLVGWSFTVNNTYDRSFRWLADDGETSSQSGTMNTQWGDGDRFLNSQSWWDSIKRETERFWENRRVNRLKPACK